MGDNKACKVVGKGKVLIKLQNENQWILNHVGNISNLRRNLISGGQVDDEDCTTTLTRKLWKVTKGSLVLGKGEKIGTLYLCTSDVCFNIALASTNADIVLSHHKLKHMGEKGM